MAILAGIDEAGFGPILGPLVVTGVAFRVPDSQLNHCLWKTLHETCTNKPTRGGHRLVVGDSKKLFRSRAGLGGLERAVLVTLATAGHRPATLRDLLDLVAPRTGEILDHYPWYANTDLPLPVTDGAGDVGTQANALGRDCQKHAIKPMGAYCELLPAGHYNQLVRSTRNKAVVLLGMVLRIVDRVLRAFPGQHLRMDVDRLGGRTHYREALMTNLNGSDLQVIEESTARSAYRLTHSGRIFEIAFVTGGDDRHFPIALASLYSKYIRELHMRLFNDYWCKRIPELRPTAGYYVDAQRWLQEAEEEISRQVPDRSMLVRER